MNVRVLSSSNNENSHDKHLSSAEQITRLLQQSGQGSSSNKRKLSDWVDLGGGSHDNKKQQVTNEDSLKKREQKLMDKLNDSNGASTAKNLQVPMSAFTALSAGSSFQPANKSSFSLESIRRLRGCSTSNDSGGLMLNVSPPQ